jgi:hypothetical protein
MYFEYPSSDGLYTHIFDFSVDSQSVWVTTQTLYSSTSTGIPIVNKQVMWNLAPELLKLSQEVKNYVDKMIKLKAFW